MNILEIGLEKGREEGRKAAERINTLNQQLAEAGRIEDIIKAASDPEYQKKLFEELGV